MRHNRKDNDILAMPKKTHRKFNAFSKVLGLLYLVALMAFEFILVILNILPAKTMLIAMVGLGVISLILFVQLFFKTKRHWTKVIAAILSVMLMGVYSFGAVYSVKTLSFLGNISTNTNRAAAKVTQEPFNVLITGMDTWGLIDSEKGRSDVNMLVTVNPKKHKILLTSVPRDYKVNLVNYDNATDKLTHTGFYGVDDTISSLEDLLDTKINYYIKVNFSTLVRFIDAIGGVDVEVEQPFNASTYNPATGSKTYYFTQGKNHLDGQAALAFARDRQSFAAGDNKRIQNQQLVFSAILKRATTNKVVLRKYSKILSNVARFTEMNLSGSEIKALVRMQVKDKPDWKISKSDVTGFDGSESTYTSATPSYVMLHDDESIAAAQQKIKDAMVVDDKKKDKDK